MARASGRQSGRQYRKFCPAVVNQPSFGDVPDDAKLVYLTLRVGPVATNLPGLVVTSSLGIADVLRWRAAGSAERAATAVKELERAGLLQADIHRRLIWIPGTFTDEFPANESVVLGWQNPWAGLPVCPLRDHAREYISRALAGRPDLYSAFRRITSENGPDGGEDGLSPSGGSPRSASPSELHRLSPETPQEQEQEQEQDILPLPPPGERGRGGVASPGKEDEEPAGFVAFWDRYPRQEHRLKALAAWEKLAPSADLAREIMAGLERWLASAQWRTPRFIPYPGNWLTAKRWEERPAPAPSDCSSHRTPAPQLRPHPKELIPLGILTAGMTPRPADAASKGAPGKAAGSAQETRSGGEAAPDRPAA